MDCDIIFTKDNIMKQYGVGAVYCMLSIIFAMEDIRYGEVRRAWLWSAIVVIAAGRFLLLGKNEGLIGLAGCVFGIFIYFLVYACLKGRLGLADVWYAGFAGAMFGPVWWTLVSILACILTFVCMLILRFRSIVFIPFMTVSGFIVLPLFFKFSSIP
jgi:hypothetical protein